MSNIKIGIIGMGRMGITHFSIINSHPNVDVVALVDTSKLILSVAQKYLHGVKVFDNYKEMINSNMLDAIIICTPPTLHFEIAKYAASKNLHVFCEKPFTTISTSAKVLKDIFQSQNLINQVGYVNRFNDVFQTVKKYLSDGLIGDLIRFKSEMYSSTIIKNVNDKTWRDSLDNGGGAVFEVASHAIDLVNFLVGKPDKIVGSVLTRIYSKNVEDAVNSTFLYKNGISGTLNVNWSDDSYRKPTNKIELFGNRGKILADQHGLKIFLKNESKEHNLIKGWNTLTITDVFKPVSFYVRGNEFTCQLYHFVSCIQDKKLENFCSFDDGASTLEIIESIREDYVNNNKF
jgi:predicted dehydrogenase